ncbi:hypothetical protein Bhyg_02626, partial [Pseudolycoriella hygida]
CNENRKGNDMLAMHLKHRNRSLHRHTPPATPGYWK